MKMNNTGPKSTTKRAIALIRREIFCYYPSIKAMEADAIAYNGGESRDTYMSQYQQAKALITAGNFRIYFIDMANLLEEIYGKKWVESNSWAKIFLTYAHLIAREYCKLLKLEDQ